MKAEAWRGLDFYRPDNHGQRCVVIGLGHVGSYIAYYLARLGVKDITAVDFDFVESHNLPHQFLAETVVSDVTEEQKILKTEVLQKTIDFMVRDNGIKYIPKKIQDAATEIIAGGYPHVIFSCVDSMVVRKWIFEKFQAVNLLVDVRTGGQFANVYSPKLGSSTQVAYYKDSLHSDAEAAPLPCTGTAIIDVAAAISAEAVNRFRLWTNDRLRVYHTFHDYSTGSHGVMACENVNENPPEDTNSETTFDPENPSEDDVKGLDDLLEEMVSDVLGNSEEEEDEEDEEERERDENGRDEDGEDR